MSVLKGVLENSVIRGRATDNGADIGTWHAPPIPQRDTSTLAADPVDLVGIWAVAPVLMKYSYDLTEAGQMADDAYDPTIDDSALRCVSDGLIRMSLGPFKIEVLEREGRIGDIAIYVQEMNNTTEGGNGAVSGFSRLAQERCTKAQQGA